MIDYAKSTDIPALVELWKEGFDEEFFAHRFFENPAIARTTLVYREEDRVVAMLNLLPCTYASSYKGVYLYALATTAKYRGRGIMTRLIQKAIEDSRAAHHDFLYVIPAESALYTYYERFGFTGKASTGRHENLVFDEAVRLYVIEEWMNDLDDLENPDCAQDIPRLQARFFQPLEELGLFYCCNEELKSPDILKVYGYLPY